MLQVQGDPGRAALVDVHEHDLGEDVGVGEPHRRDHPHVARAHDDDAAGAPASLRGAPPERPAGSGAPRRKSAGDGGRMERTVPPGSEIGRRRHRRRGPRRPVARVRIRDRHAELAGPLPGERRDDVLRPDPERGTARGSGVDVGGAPDGAHRGDSWPVISSNAATAASRADATSLSVPERNIRPKRPTARSSMTVIAAAFSASLAATAM